MTDEGVRSLYKGIAPTLAQVIPYMGLAFYLQDKTKVLLRGLGGGDKWHGLIDFTSGAIAGAAGKTIMMPMDVVRKRLQVHQF